MFRLTPPLVLPHSANRLPVKQLIAHRKKPSPIASVFPERTAPSQTSASNLRSRLFGIHHVIARSCFSEKLAVIFPLHSLHQRLQEPFGAIVSAVGKRRQLLEHLRPV